jgi:hypothetical protein
LVVECQIEPPQPEPTIDVERIARKTVTIEISLSNSADRKKNLDVGYALDELFGPVKVKLGLLESLI